MFYSIFKNLRRVKRKFRGTVIVHGVSVIRQKLSYNRVGKKILKIIFSHAGLIALLAAYTVFGAWIFQYCEYDSMVDRDTAVNTATDGINKQRERLAEELKKLGTSGPNGFEPPATPDTVRQWVDAYHELVVRAVQDSGYRGVKVEAPGNKWSLSSATLFALSIITTVGYGHVCPVTEVGRFWVIPYALLGIPFFLIFLTDHGLAIGVLLKRLFVRVCCYGLRRKRDGNLIVERVFHRKSSWHHRDRDVFAVVDKEHEAIHGDDNHVPVTLFFFLITIYVIAGMLMFWKTENWSTIQSLYFCLITLFTIGLGDLVPGYNNVGTVAGKVSLIVACLYIVVGLALITMGVSMFVDELFNKAKRMAAKLQFLKEAKELLEAEHVRPSTIVVGK